MGRKSLLRLLMGLTALLVLPWQLAAAPVRYDFKFSLNSGTISPTSAHFFYDDTTSAFTDFFVSWNGLTFDLTASANAPIVLGTIYQTQCGVTGGALAFAFLSHDSCIDDFVRVDSDIWFGLIPLDFSRPQLFAFDAISFLPSHEISVFGTAPYDPSQPPTPASSGGRWTIEAETDPTTVPEPAGLLLLVSGAASLLIIRRRRWSVPATARIKSRDDVSI